MAKPWEALYSELSTKNYSRTNPAAYLTAVKAAEVALQANTENKQRVKSAEIGATAVQLGAGYALPVGEGTQLYLNAHADLRSGATTWGAGVGLSQTF